MNMIRFNESGNNDLYIGRYGLKSSRGHVPVSKIRASR